MAPSTAPPAAGPSPPRPCLSIGVTGHRSGNAAFAANRDAVAAVLADILDTLAAAVAPAAATPRLTCLMAEGADLLAAGLARARGWQLAAPLPFGPALNIAVNAQPDSVGDARALLAGGVPANSVVAAHAQAIAAGLAGAGVFALADQDDRLAALYLAALADPPLAGAAWAAAMSERAALAARVMIEHADLVIGIWDGGAHAAPGGTGHSLFAALGAGTPVVWIDPARPADWRIVHATEALGVAPAPAPVAARRAALATLAVAATSIGDAAGAARAGGHGDHQPSSGCGPDALAPRHWRAGGTRWTLFRRMEALFGGEGRPLRRLRSRHEHPDAVPTGSGAALLATAAALPGGDPALPPAIIDQVARRFVWADAISADLSDAYRSGMTLNFLLSAAAVIVGIAYQPFAKPADKWLFALAELALLCGILMITTQGRRRGLHARWFETRRVAEYLRHAPALLLLGGARPTGHWPRARDTAWPEAYARHSLRAPGLPAMTVSVAYLRSVLADVLAPHVRGQRDYHRRKARRLNHVHHGLDRIAEVAFMLAVVSVTLYLALAALAALGAAPPAWPAAMIKPATFLGVVFPTIGAALAGIRYFGDFERFAAISDVTAEKLDSIDRRLTLLLSGDGTRIDYAAATELAHAADTVAFSEIESWQAVFAGKTITIPA